MGLNVCQHASLSDWPVRVFYGLVTVYQGLFGIFSAGTIFHAVLESKVWGAAMIAILIITGILLLLDGVLAMVRYCTQINCNPILPAMRVFHRRRPWLFLPPVFCYYITLIYGSHSIGKLQYSYYIMLALAGVLFSLRDGVISQRQRGQQ